MATPVRKTGVAPESWAGSACGAGAGCCWAAQASESASSTMKIDRMRHVIVGTAGHIDHGKTALVRALTGIDTDRLEEEKRRGISIDLGFAHLDITGSGGHSSAVRLGFIDVPGHERFIKNMLAGAGG